MQNVPYSKLYLFRFILTIKIDKIQPESIKGMPLSAGCLNMPNSHISLEGTSGFQTCIFPLIFGTLDLNYLKDFPDSVKFRIIFVFIELWVQNYINTHICSCSKLGL